MTYTDPDRRDRARKVRIDAADLSTKATHPPHVPNDDEQAPYLFSFTKGLHHEQNGLLRDPADFDAFRKGTEDHDPNTFAKAKPYRGDFDGTDTSAIKEPLEVYRRWESPTAGHAFVLQGPDPHAVTMPPAPAIGSAEFAAEMAELYEMALARDCAVAGFMDESLVAALEPANEKKGGLSKACLERIERSNRYAAAIAERLNGMRWFAGSADDGTSDPLVLHRRRHGATQHPGNLFRGFGEDAWATPFLSQFMVMGSGGEERSFERRRSGMIQYGAQRIPQKVHLAVPKKDYMTSWKEWLDVQNGLNARALVPRYRGPEAEFVEDAERPIARLRDLATYVHDDQLYQAYLNAALILLDEKYAFDPGLPYHLGADETFPFPGADAGDINRMPFALFGGPHLLSLVTEVSSRALKAVRLQKFTVHRRPRPEAAGALFHTVYSGYQPDWDLDGSEPYAENGGTGDAVARRMLGSTVATYTFPNQPTEAGSEPGLEEILTRVRKHNAEQNALKKTDHRNSWLLPMAFPEGSPMHPAYGAGHATVAGACVTLLKAMFDMGTLEEPVYLVEKGDPALVPDCGAKVDSTRIDLLCVPIERGLTLKGELDKLMWNISNGRNIAGVHYFTDYIESVLLGEEITLGILREQMLAYHKFEKVSMTVPLVVERTLPASLRNGGSIGENERVSVVRIDPKGGLHKVR